MDEPDNPDETGDAGDAADRWRQADEARRAGGDGDGIRVTAAEEYLGPGDPWRVADGGKRFPTKVVGIVIAVGAALLLALAVTSLVGGGDEGADQEKAVSAFLDAFMENDADAAHTALCDAVGNATTEQTLRDLFKDEHERLGKDPDYEIIASKADPETKRLEGKDGEKWIVKYQLRLQGDAAKPDQATAVREGDEWKYCGAYTGDEDAAEKD